MSILATLENSAGCIYILFFYVYAATTTIKVGGPLIWEEIGHGKGKEESMEEMIEVIFY